MMLSTGSTCENCVDVVEKSSKEEKRTSNVTNHKPLHPNTPLCTVAPERLITEVKDQRKKIKDLRKIIERSGVTLDSEIDSAISTILDTNYESFSPFVKLF